MRKLCHSIKDKGSNQESQQDKIRAGSMTSFHSMDYGVRKSILVLQGPYPPSFQVWIHQR